MPIYEYLCLNCNTKFEIIQKFSDTAPTICSQCSQNKIKKLTSQTAFHLKGQGWYKDGYSKEKPKTSEKTSNSQKATSTSKIDSSRTSDGAKQDNKKSKN